MLVVSISTWKDLLTFATTPFWIWKGKRGELHSYLHLDEIPYTNVYFSCMFLLETNLWWTQMCEMCLLHNCQSIYGKKWILFCSRVMWFLIKDSLGEGWGVYESKLQWFAFTERVLRGFMKKLWSFGKVEVGRGHELTSSQLGVKTNTM